MLIYLQQYELITINSKHGGAIMEQEIAKFEIRELLPIGMTIVVLGIGLAYGLQVMGETRDDMTQNTSEYNATVDAITGVAKIPAKLPTIVGVIVIAVILGILVKYLMMRFT